MAWSETMFIIQHFYNVFNIDERLTDVEYKTPLVSRSVNNLPAELPEDTTIEDLTPGTLWFVRDNNNPSTITSVSILTDNHTFTDFIPFNVDLNNVLLEDDIKQIAQSMGLTAQNYYDIIKLMLEILVTVPVNRGGTGKTSIGKDKVLVGDSNNTFKEVGFDSTPLQGSANLMNSGALFTQFQNKAAIKHSSSTTNYGVGSTTEYGHLRITDDYNDAGTDASHTAVSAKAIQELLSGIGNFLNLFQVIDEDTLFSGCISAYRPAGMGEDKLKLVDSYFSIEENSTGNYTLTIK
jgi:hypothetical protein